MGYSAGAHLAMLAAYSMDNPQLPPSCAVPGARIKVVVDLYGPTDLPLGYRTTASPRYVHDALRQFIGGSPQMFPGRYRLLSPD